MYSKLGDSSSEIFSYHPSSITSSSLYHEYSSNQFDEGHHEIKDYALSLKNLKYLKLIKPSKVQNPNKLSYTIQKYNFSP